MTNHSNHTILLCYAHPDDEAFTSGGIMAYYAGQGATVALVCATRGEVGEISDPALATPENLSHVREDELRCAGEQLGVTELTFLGFRDSGMAGTPDNENPRAFTNAPANEVVPRLVGLIRRLRPQVVITFDPNGGYGHPDHIAIHKHTVAAFHAAADPAQYPDLGPAWQSRRLLYSVLPRSLFLTMREKMMELGLDTKQFDQHLESDVGWPDDQIDFRVDVTPMLETKWAALSCHRTQFGHDNTFRKVFEQDDRRSIGYEYFVQAWPEFSANPPLDDIFAGL